MNKKLIISLITLSLLTSCSKSFELSQKNFFSFQTIVTLNTYDATKENILKIEGLMNKYSKLFDGFNSYDNINNIYTINHSNEEVEVDPLLFEALEIADFYYKETNKYFNPYLGELTFSYKKAYEEYNKNSILNLPSNDFINDSLNNLNNFSLIFNKEEYKIKRNGNCLIDLGAFAKGFALDKVKQLFKELNVNYYFINAGNSSSYFKEKPDNSFYKAGIKYLNRKALLISNNSLGISSIFEQYINVNNKIYSHIINPFNGLSEVFYDFSIVKHESCLITDIFSTVLMLTEKKDVIDKFQEKFAFSYLLYKDNKEIYSSGDLELISY